MVSLKKDPKPKGESMLAHEYEAPAYPYGTCLTLEEEQLQKLGLVGLPKVGMKVHIMAMAEVTSVSQNESKEGGEKRCVSLQITDMDPLQGAGMYDRSNMKP